MNDGFVAFSPHLAHENSGFQSDYFDTLAKLEEDSFWFRARNRLVIWTLGQYFPTAHSFFEIGCGTGYVISGVQNAFPSLQISGSEIFLAGLPFARQRLPGVSLFQMDARAIPFYHEFDIIGAFDVLEHIEEDRDVLREIYAAVKPGGGILLAVPQHKWLWSQIDDMSYHKRRYNRGDLLQKIEGVGFRIKKVTSFVSLLLPLMAMARLRYLLPSQSENYQLEFKLSRGINKIFEKILNLELSMIRLGLDFPLGGSLFVVAAKE